MPPQPMPAPLCRTCGQGVLVGKSRFRMSMPAVVLGFIFLGLAALALLIGAVGFLATGKATADSVTSIESKTRARLRMAAVPEPVVVDVVDVVAGRAPSAAQLASLSGRQRAEVQDARTALMSSTLGSGGGALIAGGISFAFLMLGLVGGVIGGLLVMKKRVLECSACQASIAAA